MSAGLRMVERHGWWGHYARVGDRAVGRFFGLEFCRVGSCWIVEAGKLAVFGVGRRVAFQRPWRAMGET